MSIEVTQRRFATVKGQSLAADVAGPENGAPVVLLHGGGQTRYSWKNGLRAFAEAGYRCYSLDARGHGESDWDKDGEYNAIGMGDDLVAALKQIPGGLPVLVGASMGGLTSMLAIANHDTPIARGLVLVDVTPRIDWDGAMKISAFMNANKDGFASVEEAADAVSLYNPNRPRPKDVSGLKRNLRERDGRWYWHWDPAFLQMGRADPDEMWKLLDAAALKVNIPTLLVRGMQSDIVGPAEVAHFRQVMPHAEYIDVQGAGHMVAGDKNDAFNNAILDFVRRLDRGEVKSRG